MVKQRARRERILEVRTMFEPCRVARQEVVRAYERLLPTRRRKIGRATEPVDIKEAKDEIRRRLGGGQ